MFARDAAAAVGHGHLEHLPDLFFLADVPEFLGRLDTNPPPRIPLPEQDIVPQDVAVAGSAEEGFRRYAYVPLWIGGLPVFIQDPQTGVLDPELELRFPIGEGDENCNFDEGGVSTNTTSCSA